MKKVSFVKKGTLSLAVCIISIFGTTTVFSSKAIELDDKNGRFIIKLESKYVLKELEKMQYLYKNFETAGQGLYQATFDLNY
ncbi:hypothetical protein PSECIP111951_02604 [Pseudoalteromonas holothuriae]|uniref:Uncharacterized protein n=1 Tax=Pseudoalteromonas holothuriae TaxID=2963714 RepID=A0ABM9GJR0_9GAMM|nr:hypothetical protein [Pseudoalteromonas sp. CIP111951]CAH9062002.1 hypothetical protein PSECIP111951_02604 [Pseudoalteromonas sp. CIP111951]